MVQTSQRAPNEDCAPSVEVRRARTAHISTIPLDETSSPPPANVLHESTATAEEVSVLLPEGLPTPRTSTSIVGRTPPALPAKHATRLPGRTPPALPAKHATTRLPDRTPPALPVKHATRQSSWYLLRQFTRSSANEKHAPNACLCQYSNAMP